VLFVVFLGAGVDELHEMCLILLCTLVIICAERPMSSLPSVLVGWLARELARHRWSAIVRIHLSDCWTDVVIVINILGGDGCHGLCRPLEFRSGHLTSGSAVEQNNSV